MIKLSISNIPNDIPKYRKKSNHIIKKSNHKHNYLPCYINDDFLNPFTNKIERKYCLATYCSVCGYIGNIEFLPFLNRNKIQKQYNLSDEDLNNLPIFIINDIFKDKYVNLNQLKGSD